MRRPTLLLGCATGMTAGFLIDLSRTSLAALNSVCSSGGRSGIDLVLAHVVLLPLSHLGMGMGLVIGALVTARHSGGVVVQICGAALTEATMMICGMIAAQQALYVVAGDRVGVFEMFLAMVVGMIFAHGLMALMQMITDLRHEKGLERSAPARHVVSTRGVSWRR